MNPGAAAEPVQVGVGMEPSYRDEAGCKAQPASEVQRFTTTPRASALSLFPYLQNRTAVWPLWACDGDEAR